MNIGQKFQKYHIKHLVNTFILLIMKIINLCVIRLLITSSYCSKITMHWFMNLNTLLFDEHSIMINDI